MKVIALLLVLFCGLAHANAARGGGYGGGYSSGSGGIQLGLSYISINTKENPQPDSAGAVSGADTEVKNSYLDIKLGYIMMDYLYLGGVYSSYGKDVTGLSTKRSLMGATAGYHRDGYFLDFTYYFNGKLSDRYATGDEFNSPGGYAIEFGYNATIAANFYLGAEIAYKALTYKKYKPSGGTEVSTSWNQTELYPMLSLGFVF